jgi:hypothetical protein
MKATRKLLQTPRMVSLFKWSCMLKRQMETASVGRTRMRAQMQRQRTAYIFDSARLISLTYTHVHAYL